VRRDLQDRHNTGPGVDDATAVGMRGRESVGSRARQAEHAPNLSEKDRRIRLTFTLERKATRTVEKKSYHRTLLILLGSPHLLLTSEIRQWGAMNRWGFTSVVCRQTSQVAYCAKTHRGFNVP